MNKIWMTRNGIVEQFDADRLENLLIKGWVVCDEPIPPIPIIPDPYDIFDAKQVLKELQVIFALDIGVLAGQASMIIWFTENKYFYDLNRYLILAESQSIITAEYHASVCNVFVNQNIDLSKEPYRARKKIETPIINIPIDGSGIII